MVSAPSSRFRSIPGCSGLLAIAALAVGCAGTALAANADVQVTVSPIPTAVSVKRDGLTTYAAYQVTVQSSTTNVINQAVFAASANVVGGTSGDAAPYVQTVPAASCLPGATTSSVQCAIGQLRGVSDPVGSKASFVVIFKAPGSGSELDLNWTFTYSNGNSPNSTPSTILSFSGTTATQLVTSLTADQRVGFTSYFPTTGGAFFTAFSQANVVGGVATASANWTTTVLIPNQVTPNTVTVVQSDSLQSCSADVTVCKQSDITIPNQTFNGLTFILRRDASTIKPGAKIANAVIYYQHLPTLAPVPVHACAITGGPQPGAPCMASSTAYTKKNAPTPDFIGDWEFVISAVDNGRFTN